MRATLGTRLPIAFEMAYVGTAQGMNALGLDTNAILLGSTAEGDVRINILRGRVQPYVFGGVGYTYYRITNTAIATSDLQRTDNVLEVPFGAGLSWRLGQAFLLDIRGTGRLTTSTTCSRTPLRPPTPGTLACTTGWAPPTWAGSSRPALTRKHES